VARRSSLFSAYTQMQREAARAQAAQVRAQAAARREAERAHAAYMRAVAAEEKERKRLYIESRAAHVAAMNADLETTLGALERLLAASLEVGDVVSFSSLKVPASKPPWEHARLERGEPVPVPEAFMPAPLSGMGKLFGKAKHQQAVAEGQARYGQAVMAHRNREAQRASALKKARAEWQAAAAQLEEEAKKQHELVDAFEANYRRGELNAVVSYCSIVLEASAYPDGFPQAFKLAYVPESRQAVVEYELPTVDVVPTVKAYRYVKQSDSIAETARPYSQVKALYASSVAQVAIRTVHELLISDKVGHIDTVVFNGHVDTTDPGSGRHIHPCLVTVRATRETFDQLDLTHVEPLACLKHLSAGVSKSPAELVPVRPVVEFSMVDPRFVAESDALSGLDQRPNLMELKPTEFEALIHNLFVKMGLDARQTRPSRDGGVDCVAWDPRPIFGGKVVIQAKRYKNTVGVSAVRDLFGTLQNEGASKGILVTTSGYGQASFDFARNKPIELIDGSNLLYLLTEHTGIEAKIVPPDDWLDPIADSPRQDIEGYR
jgi:restriction system protein